MTMCPNSKAACECQPQDGVMCPHGPTPPYPVAVVRADLYGGATVLWDVKPNELPPGTRLLAQLPHGVQEDDEAIAPERLRMADALDEIAKPLAQGSASIVRRAAEMLRRTHVVLGIDSTGWVRLADSDWVNIVNAPSVLDPLKDKEEAVREAVKLTEARLKALNVGPWCCPNGRAQGLEVCRDCAEANAGYLAAMGPPGVRPTEPQEEDRKT